MRVKIIDKRTKEVILDWFVEDFQISMAENKDKKKMKGAMKVQDNVWEEERRLGIQVDLKGEKDWWRNMK